jgi:hypothetical protein
VLVHRDHVTHREGIAHLKWEKWNLKSKNINKLFAGNTLGNEDHVELFDNG